MSITTQTRWDSFEKLNPSGLYGLILSVLREHKSEGLTAREIAVSLYNKNLIKDNSRQAIAPRMTELVDKGIVTVVGKKLDGVSGKMVAAYALV